MQFKDIVGQRLLINRLTKIIDSGRIPNTQLLLGRNGFGTLALALAYAQYLNCSNRQHFQVSDPAHELEADSCGQCPHCRKIQALMHGDLHLVFPTAVPTGMKADHCNSDVFQEEFRKMFAQTGGYMNYDEWINYQCSDGKQGLVRDGDAASIVTQIGMMPIEAPYKTIILWRPEIMTPKASNEVLKSLEEPTGSTVILLVSDQPESILPTIYSRSQTIRVGRIDDADLIPAVAAKADIAGREQAVAAAAEGDFIAAMQYLSDSNVERLYADRFVEWMRKLFKLNMAPLIAWVDGWKEASRDEKMRFLRYSQDAVRACFLKSQAGIVLAHRIQFGDAKFDERFPYMITVNNIEAINAAFDDAIMAISRNGYDKLVFMKLSFTLSLLLKKA